MLSYYHKLLSEDLSSLFYFPIEIYFLTKKKQMKKAIMSLLLSVSFTVGFGQITTSSVSG